MSEKNFYRIKVITTDGQTLFWHKGDKIQLLPEELAEIWVTRFKPHLFEITSMGEMVGAGRSPVPSFKISRVEKVLAKDTHPEPGSQTSSGS